MHTQSTHNHIGPAFTRSRSRRWRNLNFYDLHCDIEKFHEYVCAGAGSNEIYYWSKWKRRIYSNTTVTKSAAYAGPPQAIRSKQLVQVHYVKGRSGYGRQVEFSVLSHSIKSGCFSLWLRLRQLHRVLFYLISYSKFHIFDHIFDVLNYNFSLRMRKCTNLHICRYASECPYHLHVLRCRTHACKYATKCPYLNVYMHVDMEVPSWWMSQPKGTSYPSLHPSACPSIPVSLYSVRLSVFPSVRLSACSSVRLCPAKYDRSYVCFCAYVVYMQKHMHT